MGPFPIEPLATKLGITLHQPGRIGAQDHRHRSHEPVGLNAIAHRLGLAYDTVRKAATHGLTDRQADHWAIRCGYMPEHLWPDLWWTTAPDEDPDWYSDDPPLNDCTPGLHTTMDQP